VLRSINSASEADQPSHRPKTTGLSEKETFQNKKGTSRASAVVPFLFLRNC